MSTHRPRAGTAGNAGGSSPARGQASEGGSRRREKSNSETLREQTKLLNELKKTNDQFRALLREKYPEEVDQRYLGIWIEKKEE